MIPSYQELIELSKEGVRLEWAEKSALRLEKKDHPISLKQREFKFLFQICEELALNRGFEVATAFGVSSLAPALSMKNRNGKIVTMDSYAEEKEENCIRYRLEHDVRWDSLGIKSVKNFITHFGLEAVLFPEVGHSPTHTAKHILKHFGEEKLNYAFIDAYHTDHATNQDFLAIEPFIDKAKYLIALHDPYEMYPSFVNSVSEKLSDAKFFQPSIFSPPHGYSMSLITNQQLNIEEIFEKSLTA